MQEGPQEERQVLPNGRSEGDEHGWEQLVSHHAIFQLVMKLILFNRIHKSKYMDDTDAKNKKARSKSRTRNIFGIRIKESKEAKEAREAKATAS